MTAQERRPRIRPEIADHVDQMRGEIPFERFVNTALGKALTDSYTLEKGDARGTFRIADQDGTLGRELPPVEAAEHLEVLNELVVAVDALTTVQSFYEGFSVDLYSPTERAMQVLDDLIIAEHEFIGLEEQR